MVGMTGIELNMVVPDCLAALELYERIFDSIERVEVTSLEKGKNEAVFILHSMQIHMLDENEAFGLMSPAPDSPPSMWLNVIVNDIDVTFKKAVNSGCGEIQPITEIEAMGVKNAMFSDPFGYIWLLHEIVREVSFEERVEAISE